MSEEKGLDRVFYAVGSVLVIPAVLARGLAVAYLWRWFITPFGVMQIGVMWGAGLSLMVAILTHKGGKVESSGYDFFKSMLAGIILSLMAIGCGWLIHYFM